MPIDLSKIKKETTIETQGRNTTLRDFLDKDFSVSKKLGAKHKVVLYKDLSTLLSAEVDFKTALEILAHQQKKEFIRLLLLSIRDRIVKGKSFYEALQLSGSFSAYEYFSIKIGEETKKLDTVLLELHKYYRRQIKLRKQIISVVTYPAFVLVLTFGVLYFMLTYVVPMFKSVFNQFDSELPALTKNIILLSEKFPMIFLGFLAILLCIVVFFKIYGHHNWFRHIKAKVVLRIPFFGRLIRLVYLARYCQFMDLLLTSRTSLTVALDMVKKMIGFYPIENSIATIKADVVKGIPLATAMKKHKIYDYKLTSMIAVAEEINELDTMFSRLADEYDEEVEHKTKMIGVILEPLIILVIGGIVGLIMVAMYAPMFDLSKIINQ